ncbi:heat-inducible transcription repressor HrcA [Alkalilimnicola ehrlichii]|uniref:Heat-inducible transcription repressor HrcA n=1 Tax=Alkalilimnicola ehrlichii TaxID=351052 RepID=A0A3E0WS88_9GAMM|nr:heat-inducible transcriptional repressor HrcA [Alkalilimnicola ehrlichii]RFA28236.1 heat-inducible transcription repressor HrcA [Alkalilimnicola ehrlichii]RFA34837.1 heat-inducible transcription repressor HrcA [Alkalilimnicola ehrlichii]
MARKPVDHGSLGERAQHLLKVLVQRHIRDGQPVGSRILTRDSGLSLSPATIRNVMADLEELGYVQAPHTSAGRVPTDKGYRFFVDSLLTVRTPDLQDAEKLNIRLDEGGGANALVDSASNLLSGLTRLAGVVTLPRREYAALRRVEFLPLSDNRVLAILIVNDEEIQNRVIETERHFTADELREVSNYLNVEFAGKDVASVRTTLLNDMEADQESMNRSMSSVRAVAEKLFAEDKSEQDYVLAGQTNLMEFAELSNVEKLRELFNAFTRKRDVLHLLDQSLRADGIQIFIGQESGYEVFDGCSLVTSSYTAHGQVLGVLGVIGPTRMAYDRVIPIVDMTAKLLGNALNQRDGDRS